MDISEVKITGAGSPIVDMLAQIDEDFVRSYVGAKGGMELINDEQMQVLLELLPKPATMAAGGSAANTISALARLGGRCGFLGKLGNDELAEDYLKIFKSIGGDAGHFKYSNDHRTAVCISMITPDHERTMRTCLRAAAMLGPDEIESGDFEGYDLIHIEGYLLFNRELTYAIMSRAKEAGCRISLDLGSFEIVKMFKDTVVDLLEKYVDIVFANEDEAEAFSGDDDLQSAIKQLGSYCEVAVVKMGAEGSMILCAGEIVDVAVEKVDNVIDTTGAGDYWAAGFLYGYLTGKPMEICGRMGSILGAEVVTQIGAVLLEERWKAVKEKFENLCSLKAGDC